MACLFKRLFYDKNVMRLDVYEMYQISKTKLFKNVSRSLSTRSYSTDIKSPLRILGIETSGNDTGAAVVNEEGQILGEVCYPNTSSTLWHDITPFAAANHHERHIHGAVTEALEKSNISPADLSGVAVTVRPGKPDALKIGRDYGKRFALKHNLPLIPIHHMEAHALTVRMENEVEFPFVSLIASGADCILCICHSINNWSVIGKAKKLTPGVALDEIALTLSIQKLPDLSNVPGGKGMEIAAKEGNPQSKKLHMPDQDYQDPNFMFSDFTSFAQKLISNLEFNKGVKTGTLLENVEDLSASFQHYIVKHMVQRTHLGIKFLEHTKRILPKNRTLVVSGGVASNEFFRKSFKILCDAEGYKLLMPPPNLCTNNGVMVAWNGIEKWRAGLDILRSKEEINTVCIEKIRQLGPDLSKECIRTRMPKIKNLTIAVKPKVEREKRNSVEKA